MRSLHKLLLLPVLLAHGCGGNTSGGVYRTPMVERGACATIMMPGQSMPMPEPGESPGCAGGYASIAGGGVVEEGEKATKTEPHPAVKVLTAPFVILLFPFKVLVAGAEKLGDVMDGDDEVPLDPRLRGAQGTVAKVDPQVAHEREQLGALERELAKRGGSVSSSASGPAAPTASATASAPAPSGSSRLRIADELAALRGAAPGAPPTAEPAVTTPRAASPGVAPDRPPADRVLDRDGDGQPDHWIHLQNGQVAREEFDENGDRQPDRAVWRDPVTGQEQRIEEDRNADGRPDLISEYRNGQISRVRRDDNFDGAPDAWSYYQSGTLVREELDPDGDGFRNRVVLYRDGRLSREREDRDGDGRIDRLTHYDAEERILRRDEDQDGDGLVDARAFYEAGRLVRRELVSESQGDFIEEEEGLSSAAWSVEAPEASP
jgi:hypothetical protein